MTLKGKGFCNPDSCRPCPKYFSGFTSVLRPPGLKEPLSRMRHQRTQRLITRLSKVPSEDWLLAVRPGPSQGSSSKPGLESEAIPAKAGIMCGEQDKPAKGTST